MSEDAERLPDVRALLAAKHLARLLALAALLDSPAHTRAVRVLSARSEVVLTWARWEWRGALLLPVGLSLNATGVWDMVTGTNSWWTVPALGVGTVVLCTAVVGLWLANQSALKLAVGAYLDVTPPGRHGDEID